MITTVIIYRLPDTNPAADRWGDTVSDDLARRLNAEYYDRLADRARELFPDADVSVELEEARALGYSTGPYTIVSDDEEAQGFAEEDVAKSALAEDAEKLRSIVLADITESSPANCE